MQPIAEALVPFVPPPLSFHTVGTDDLPEVEEITTGLGAGGIRYGRVGNKGFTSRLRKEGSKEGHGAAHGDDM